MFKKGWLSRKFLKRTAAATLVAASIPAIFTTDAYRQAPDTFTDLKSAAASTTIGNYFRWACSADMKPLISVTIPKEDTPQKLQDSIIWDQGIPHAAEEEHFFGENAEKLEKSKDIREEFKDLLSRIENLHPGEKLTIFMETGGGSLYNTMRAASALQNTKGAITFFASHANSGGTILAIAISDKDRHLFVAADAHLTYPMIMQRIKGLTTQAKHSGSVDYTEQEKSELRDNVERFMAGEKIQEELPAPLTEILSPYKNSLKGLSESCQDALSLDLLWLKYAHGFGTRDIIRLFGGIIVEVENPDGSLRALVRKGSFFDQLEYKTPAAAATPPPRADLQ